MMGDCGSYPVTKYEPVGGDQTVNDLQRPYGLHGQWEQPEMGASFLGCSRVGWYPSADDYDESEPDELDMLIAKLQAEAALISKLRAEIAALTASGVSAATPAPRNAPSRPAAFPARALACWGGLQRVGLITGWRS